jgi:TonB-linked SusC/RagA family outer membrane protein
MITLSQKVLRRCSHFLGIALLMQCLPVSTLLASQIDQTSVGVNEVYATLEFDNENVIVAFKKIEEATGFTFSYNNSDVADKNVSGHYKHASLLHILRDLSRQSRLKFRQYEDIINVKADEPVNNLPVAPEQAAFTVTGMVTGPSNGEPMPGVNVVEKGTSNGTTTDAEGKYSLSVSDGTAVLVFSFIGFANQEVNVNGRSVVDIVLVEDVKSLEEVVVVGYGEQKKVNLTGAVDVVSAKQIKERAVANVTEALQGISPNLNISTGAFSAEPGGKMNLNIRGVGSLSGDYSPYILVDGVPMDLNAINPSDIESLTILKDAAASAIYGARAPYGVILITTKKGEMNEKIKVEYSNNISFSSPIGLPHMSNALVYATAYDQASVNAGLSPNFTPENYERIRQYMAGEITEETWLKPDGSDWMGNGIWSIAGNGNNDWLYIYYKDKVMRQKHDVNISGGGKKNSFFVSAGYWDQPGELTYGDQYYKRYNVTANLVSKPTDWLSFNLGSKYIGDNTQYFNSGYGGGEAGRAVMYHNFYRTNVFRPRILPNGEFSDISNIDILNGGKENYFGSNYLLSLGTTIEPVKNWVTTIRYNYRNHAIRGNNNQQTVWGTFPDGTRYAHAYPISSYESTFSNTAYTLFNIVSSYTKTIKGHYFLMMVGHENELNQYNSLWGKKNNIITSLVPSISTSTGTLYLDDTKSHWATEGFFGRFNYNYKEKYLFEVNARYDGSSKFERETRWGFFPSLSVGYNISSEDFWKAFAPYINGLKIRGSWGSLGNQNVPNYLYVPTLGIGTNSFWITGSERPNYTTAPNLISANLTWETATTTNVGLDASFLGGRLKTSFDVYSRITSNMFGPSEALPLTLGTTAPRSNNATLQTRGFEVVLDWEDDINANLTYTLRGTLSDNVSVVKQYNNPTKTLTTWYEGARIGEIWGLQTDGIYQSDADAASGPDQTLFWPTWGAGDIQYKDVDGEGAITRGSWTADDSGDYGIIGNNSPRFLAGLVAGLSWKGFDFSMFWQGILKRDYAFSGTDMSFFGFNGHQWWGMNMWEQTEDYWRPAGETNSLGPNTDAYYPKPYLSQQDYKNKQIQTRYMQNAAYVRLKNATLGYTIPASFTERIAISRAKVFISGENLFTITSLTKLIDPETLTNSGWGVGKVHPLRKAYAVGINLTF